MLKDTLDAVKRIANYPFTNRDLLRIDGLSLDQMESYINSKKGLKWGSGPLNLNKFPQGKDELGQAYFRDARQRKLRRLKSKGADVTHLPWSAKRFVGIELELCIPKENYTKLIDFNSFGMTIKNDGSIRTNYELACEEQERRPVASEDCDSTIEISLLQEQGNYARLKALLEFLNANGAYVNKTCGLHVHLDQRHNDKKEANKVFSRLQNAVAPLLSKMVDQTRLTPDGTNYCRISSDKRQKYQAVNFKPYNDGRKTIEVRLHHGTLDFDEITNWIDTLILVSEAKGLVRPKKQKTMDETLTLLKMGAERQARIKALAVKKLEGASLMDVSE